MKRTIMVLTAIMMVLALLIPTACAAPKFELSSLEVTPSKVATGDTATVTVDLANVGTAEGTYVATLSIDGVVAESKQVTIPAGATRKVTFAVVEEAVGVYSVEVGDLRGTLQVVKPAEFRLSLLVVTPSEPLLGDPVTVTVDVRNIGGLEGDYACTLLVNGVAVQRQEVTLDGDETTTVTFVFTPKSWGSWVVKAGDLTQTVKALRPAEFRVSSLTISPDETVAGSSVTVTADVRNIGDVEGSHTVTLKVDGSTAGSKTVSLAGGERTTVRFTVVKDTYGIHSIKVNTLIGTLAVLRATPAGYKGYTDWENGFFIAYPEGWERTEVTFAVVEFVFVEPMGEGEEASFNVLTESLAQLTTAEDYLESAVEIMETLFVGLKVISTEELTINGIPAFRVVYTWTIAGTRMKFQQVALVRDKTAFVITLGALVSTYDKYADTFDTIVNSFQFLP